MLQVGDAVELINTSAANPKGEDFDGKIRFCKITSGGEGYQTGDIVRLAGGDQDAEFEVVANDDVRTINVKQGTFSGSRRSAANGSDANDGFKTETFSPFRPMQTAPTTAPLCHGRRDGHADPTRWRFDCHQ